MQSRSRGGSRFGSALHRLQLERLCRYITRPPLAQDRLDQRPDGRLELVLKRVWKDGTRAIKTWWSG